MFTEAVFIEETTALRSAPKSRWWVDPTIWPRSSASTRAGLVVSAVGVRLGPQRTPRAGGPGEPPAAWAVAPAPGQPCPGTDGRSCVVGRSRGCGW